jgi:RNA polymerase sigma factor (sigma-70 family)
VQLKFDIAFINKLKAGDSLTQRLFFDKCYARLIRVSQRYLARMDEAEDCVMSALIKAFQNIDSYTHINDDGLYIWTKRILVNECLMQIRKKTLFSPQPVDGYYDYELDAGIIDAIDAKYLLDLITKLPIGYRTVFNLFVIEGYSHSQIAQMLNIQEGTSKSQLAKAKSYLKKIVTQESYGYKSS